MEKKMTFKEKLTVLRKNKGLTQDEFAKAVGVSRQAVYKWENGNSYPEVPKLLEIKALFGISLDDLFDDSYEVATPEKKKRSAKKAVTDKVETPAEEIKAPIAEEKAPAVEEKKPEAVAEAPAKEENDAIEEVVYEDKDEEKVEAQLPWERKVGFFERIFGRK